MGFIPPDENVEPIVVALENALPDVLDASVGELNVKNVIDKLGDVMYEFPFSLPPFYIAIIRCLGVLEGLAIQVEPEFRIISDAYPYISSRLLTDTSPELQAALQQLLFKEGRARWDRLEQLLGRASLTRDYDVSQAVDKLVDYLISEKGTVIREQLITEIIEGADELGDEATRIVELAVVNQRVPVLEDISSSRLATASRLVAALSESRGFESQKLLPIARRLGNEPVLRQGVVDIAAAVSERAISKTIRRIFVESDV
jgi:aarF domain-containing kinase